MKGKEIIHIPKEQVHEKPAETNFGQLIQYLTERHNQKTTTDLGTVEWSRFPVDQMVSEALMAIIAKLAQVHKLQISTQRRVESILPRLNHHLELGIAINGGPLAVADRFDKEVIPQIEAEIARLSESGKITPQKLWQLPVARLLAALMSDVKRRAEELDGPVRQIVENNDGRVTSFKIDLGGYLDDNRSRMRELLDWRSDIPDIPAVRMRKEDEDKNKSDAGIIRKEADYLMNGRAYVARERLRASACEKLPVPAGKKDSKGKTGEPPWEVIRSANGTELDNALTTQYALFLIEKEGTYLSADELQQALKASKKALKDQSGTLSRFKAHLQNKFHLSQEELTALGEDLAFTMQSVTIKNLQEIDFHYNHIWFQPFEGKKADQKLVRLKSFGCSEGLANGILREAEFVRRSLFADLDLYRTGNMPIKELLPKLSVLFDEPAAEVFFIMENMTPEDIRTAFLELEKDDEFKNDRVSAGIMASVLKREGADSKKLKLSKSEQFVEAVNEAIDRSGKLGPDQIETEIKKLMELARALKPEEREKVILSNRDLFASSLSISVDSGGDWTGLKKLLKKEVWERLVLAAHVTRREMEYTMCYEEAELHILPWERQFSKVCLELRLLDKDASEIRRLMEKYSEQDCFYWLNEREKTKNKRWKEYEKKRKSFFEDRGPSKSGSKRSVKKR